MGYFKRMILQNKDELSEVVIRNYKESDFLELIKIQEESFPPPYPSEAWWNEEQLMNHVTLFPDGALCVEVNGSLAGSMTGLLVDFNPKHPEHTWNEITDEGYIRNHNANGNTLYVVDICIRPAFRKMDLGKWLMQSMYETVVHKGLDRLLGGGRLPGYYKHAEKMSIDAYVEAVVNGEMKDPVASFLLRCGRTPVSIVADYLEDEESHNYALLMEWRNPFKAI
ncbi:GNAT family N-acetyltransferase [Evansella cellulosilytica]|uniref:GCN5-related N-acetyltransferase n=1 Tax=Evansella cellulosilytica (strain ATCC 21833 / DSM 2522 / FERM P-1141 / JCM 9156 / N-4) TaxID=649639 RepID=E6U0T9_EVAC2|nr:GNAT family N-acetyltransferase [Evansella cellulosilytica]ADU29137.1 GCN5-related N-acetyltransferase [Evansella cellulosilytica DSM 2522]